MSLCINLQCQKSNNPDTTIFCQGCGSELLLDGRYRVIRELGQGGFGKIYEIVDLNGRPWVLKVLINDHPKCVELFQQEAQILSVLNHPGVPKIDLDGYFSYFSQDKNQPLHCLVMEKIEGLNLSQYIKQRGNRPIKQKRALRWLAELTLIIEQLHNQNYFHRDIEPSNIMLRANGCLVLIDFGTAREISKSYIEKQAAGQITGVVTQGYTPMEQMECKAVLQSDFYALGGTMIFLLTSQNPNTFYDFSDRKFHWHEATQGVSPQFIDLIDRMVALLPRDRPASSREIFNEIIAIEPSLSILDKSKSINYDFTPSTTTFTTPDDAPTPTSISKPVFSAPSPANSQITPEFLERCRQELAEFIGPMANLLCHQALEQNPHLSRMELCRILAKNISNPEHASNFQERLR